MDTTEIETTATKSTATIEKAAASSIASAAAVEGAKKKIVSTNNKGGSSKSGKNNNIIRDSLNGSWVLDKSRGNWSMRGYLETLNVPELAIQANEKGENELDTIHTIDFLYNNQRSSSSSKEEEIERKVRITKQSRVNNGLVVELILGKENVEYLQPDDRPKKQIATTDDLIGQTHLKIISSLLTVYNGMANVTDIKKLIRENNNDKIATIEKERGSSESKSESKSLSSVMVQELTIHNPETKKTHTTTRYFYPYEAASSTSSAS